MIEGFAKEMKLGTKESHSMAESTSFVKKFLGGVVEEENYRTLVANFYFVYRALEEQIDRNSDDPIIAPLAKMTELKREPALEKDLAYFYGGSWFLDVDPTDACKTYIDRILHCNMEELVGHHYTRYLGDLSGGQILKTIAEKALNLDEKGLAFYKFDIEDKKAYKEKYRETLNTLPLTTAQQNTAITEANFAFRLNMYMFDELEGSSARGLWNVFINTMFATKG